MLVIVWVVHLYWKITSVSYSKGCVSGRKDTNVSKLLYGLCICKGR